MSWTANRPLAKLWPFSQAQQTCLNTATWDEAGQPPERSLLLQAWQELLFLPGLMSFNAIMCWRS